MGIKELALAVTISSSFLVGCQAAKPLELITPPTLPPAVDPDHQIDLDKLKLPPEDHPEFHPAPEAASTKEAGQPIIIWFVGSSTMKNFELIAGYIQRLFPQPRFRFAIGGRPGAQIEDLTAAITDDSLIPIIDKQPASPANVNFIVVYGGANDLFADEPITSMENETDDLFATLASKYPNANFIYIKPYHLSGKYTDKNPGIDDFNRSISPNHLIGEVKKRTGRTVSIATIDINGDLDNCNPQLLRCFLDDRHASPPILQDMIDKTKDIIDPLSPVKPTPLIPLLPLSTLWLNREKKTQRKTFRGQKNKYW